MSLTRNIKQVLTLLQKAVKQTPVDKRTFLTQKVGRVIETYRHLNPEDNQASYLKELQFNLNFIRLSFPHLDYSLPVEAQPQKLEKKQNEIDPQRVKEEFFELQNQEQVRNFLNETEKTLKGIREEVQFSNWGTDNLDPEDLKRHKQLLKRQYFSGQFWKQKEKPTSPTASFLMNMMQNEPDGRHQKIVVQQSAYKPQKNQDFSNNWQKVKR